jgi:hypothetical protein
VAEEHLEHSVFTWDPVGARWVHEKGPLMSTPPVPPDVHAIQTYFYDPDEKEWIATVLAPRGRELAAQWEGAHKVPDQAAPAAAPKKSAASVKPVIPTPIITISNLPTEKSGPPIPLFAIVLVLLIVGGGAAAVVAGTQSGPNASPAATTGAPGTSTKPSGPVAVTEQPTATPAGETPAPTQAPGGTPVPTARTAAPTPVPTAPPPVANSITLSDGSVVTYNGPSRVNIGEKFAVTFTVRNANNTPGTGTFLVSFGNSSTGGSKTSSGTLDGSGRLVVNMQGNSLPGNYPFVANYKGLQGQVTIVRVG